MNNKTIKLSDEEIAEINSRQEKVATCVPNTPKVNGNRLNPKKDKKARRVRTKNFHGEIREVTRGIKRPRICAKCAQELIKTPEKDRESKKLYPRRHGSKYCEVHAKKAVGQGIT
jgi:hypothetical protein